LRERERREKNLPREKHLHLTASSSSPKWEEKNQKKKGTTDNFATTKGEKKKKKKISVFDLSSIYDTINSGISLNYFQLILGKEFQKPQTSKNFV
jgi:hypothetical protein